METRFRRDIGFDTDDRLDTGFLRGLLEFVGAEHVTMICHTDRRHPETGGLSAQGIDLGRTVQHRVLGVNMQMDKRIASHRSPFLPCPSLNSSGAYPGPPHAAQWYQPQRPQGRRCGGRTAHQPDPHTGNRAFPRTRRNYEPLITALGTWTHGHPSSLPSHRRARHAPQPRALIRAPCCQALSERV